MGVRTGFRSSFHWASCPLQGHATATQASDNPAIYLTSVPHWCFNPLPIFIFYMAFNSSCLSRLYKNKFQTNTGVILHWLVNITSGLLLLAISKGLKMALLLIPLKAQGHTEKQAKPQKNKRHPPPPRPKKKERNFKCWKYAETKEKALSCWMLYRPDNSISYNFKSCNFSHIQK